MRTFHSFHLQSSCFNHHKTLDLAKRMSLASLSRLKLDEHSDNPLPHDVLVII